MRRCRSTVGCCGLWYLREQSMKTLLCEAFGKLAVQQGPEKRYE